MEGSQVRARKKSVWTSKRGDARFRKVGRRMVVIRDDEREVITHGQWLVCVCDSWSDAEWVSLKLLLMAPARKNVWYLGWSRSRQAFKANREWRLLEEHHGQTAEWLQGGLRGDLGGFLNKAEG